MESVVSAPSSNPLREPGAPEAPGGTASTIPPPDPDASPRAAIEAIDLDAVEITSAQPAAEKACAADPAAPARWGVLRHRHYRNVILSQFVSNCGNWMEMMGLQVVFAEFTD